MLRPVIALGLTVALAAPAHAAEDFVPGTGSASAGVVRVSLRSSGASIGFGLAQTRARYVGAQGNAESAGVDMGLFETVGKAPVACGTAPGAFLPEDARPQRLVVSSGSGADQKSGASFGAGTPVEIMSQSGSAAPNAKADATVGGVRFDVPGLLTVIGGAAQSGAHLVPGKQRTATATSTLGRLVLAGGAVELEGLQWKATESTGATKASQAGFTMGAVVVGGQRTPVSDDGSLATALDAANKALEPIGLALHAPRVEPTQTGSYATPLRLSINSTPQLRALLAPSLDAIQPIRSQLLELVKPLQMSPDCGFAKALGFGYLIADLALIAMGDGGGIDLDLGGARAGTDATAYANPLDSRFGAIAPPGLPVVPGIPAPAQPTPLTPAAASPPAATDSAPQALEIAAPTTVVPVAAVCRSTHSDSGCTGRNGLLAAWLALAVVVLLAAADWIRRRA
ncbi:MAG: hypothetical protein ACT4QG_00200 [Sporichthyaceae bacterium]